MKKIALSGDELAVLRQLSPQQLRNFVSLKESQTMQTMIDTLNIMIDIDKNIFFGTNEMKFTSHELAIQHAFVRGGLANYTKLIHIIGGAATELANRDKERQRIKEQKETV